MHKTRLTRPRWLPQLTPGVFAITVITAGCWLAMAVLRAVVGAIGDAGHPGLATASVWETLFDHVALIPGGMLEYGPQGLLTLVLVHDGLFHVGFNLLALASLGPWVERALGLRRFLVLYLVSALCGSLLHVAWSFAFGDPMIPVVGASGAVMGVLAGFALLFPTAQVQVWVSAPLRASNLIWLAVAVDAIFVIADPRIAVTVHLGGILGAILYLRRPWRPGAARRLWADIGFGGKFR